MVDNRKHFYGRIDLDKLSKLKQLCRNNIWRVVFPGTEGMPPRVHVMYAKRKPKPAHGLSPFSVLKTQRMPLRVLRLL